MSSATVRPGPSIEPLAAAFYESIYSRCESIYLDVRDPQGWLVFGAVGAFVLWANLVALRRASWHRGVAVLGCAMALAYAAAWAGLLFGIPMLITIAAGAGAVVLAPLWWLAMGLRWLKAPLETASGGG